MTKQQLRNDLRARRRGFVMALRDEGRLDQALLAMTDRIIAHAGDARSIAAYWPIGAEADTRPLLSRLTAGSRTVGLPYIESPDSSMRFLRWRPDESLEPGAHGLLQPRPDAEPLHPDLIVTPLLGFDRRLMRLGQGAGYYDRLFAQWPDIRRIGLAWSVQEVEEAPADPWDVALHGIATEIEWIAAETP